jgi:hypothetical protein
MEELDISFNPSISSIEIYKKLKKKIRITEWFIYEINFN